MDPGMLKEVILTSKAPGQCFCPSIISVLILLLLSLLYQYFYCNSITHMLYNSSHFKCRHSWILLEIPTLFLKSNTLPFFKSMLLISGQESCKIIEQCLFLSSTITAWYFNTAEKKMWKTLYSATKNPNKEMKQYQVSFKFLHFMPVRIPPNLQL